MGGGGLIVSVSGIRGIIGEDLNPEVAAAFAAALGTYVEGKCVALSRDSRPSGTVLRHAVLAGLLGAGCEVRDLGVVPTPTCGLAVRRLGAAGAVQITASHNPAEWTGLKLFGPAGGVLTAEEGQRIKALFEGRRFRRAAWDRLGRAVDEPDGARWHCDQVLELVDADRTRARRPRVFLDANGGAGGPLGRRLLEALGCDVIAHACEADGVFRHEPEPVEANLRSVAPGVAEQRADVGFVLDPDADRLALIDENGRPLSEELTLALAVLTRLRQEEGGTGGPVVVNMSTSRVVEDVARRFGRRLVRSAVGEANVVAMMRAEGSPIGGEGNGGVIDPRVGFVRDPFIGMALILSLLAEAGRPLSGLVADLPAYTIVKEKHTVDPAHLPELFRVLTARWPDALADRRDGLRLDWSDRWLHVRASNTEPVVRAIAEAPTRAAAEALCREAAAVVRGIGGL